MRLFTSVLLLFLCTSPFTTAQKAGSPAPSTTPVDKYTWRVTVGNRAPDCFERPVLLVNEEFGPTLEVHQGDLIEIDLINDIPLDFPLIPGGISIHW
jgi:L-ascorbate oxidase